MGVLRGLKGLEVRVKINGAPVAEYDCDSEEHELADEENHFVKYIESEPGEKYSVDIVVLRKTPFPGEHISADVFIDGEKVDELLFPRRSGELSRKEVLGRRQKLDAAGANALERFRFESFRTAPSGRLRSLDPRKLHLPELGEIKVVFGLKTRVRPDDRSDWPAKVPNLSGNMGNILPEEAIKGRGVSSHTR
jgi:hypothetical protein